MRACLLTMPWRHLLLLLVVLSCQLSCLHAIVKVDPSIRPIPLMRDEQGRVVLYHGVNVIYKVPPYVPPLDGPFDPMTSLNKEDMEFMQRSGFNVVRLYVSWAGVMPTPGVFNKTYIQAVEAVVNRLYEYGIRSILDCHQDLFSPKFCGEGAPDFAALYENRTIKPRPFPVPFPQFTPFTVDPTTGYPPHDECLSHPFFYYCFSDAVSKATESFYRNEQGVQDSFVDFWTFVAQTFKGSDAVLGYELLNEPWLGDIYTYPSLFEAGVADKRNLQPLYERLHQAIRTVDDEHIIFFEPTVFVSQLPGKALAHTGLTQGPGGPAYNDRQVFAYHDYCLYTTHDGQPADQNVCSWANKEFFATVLEDLKRVGTAGFLTEWGALSNGTGIDKLEAFEVCNDADAYLQSWTYWAFKPYHDITTQATEPDGTVSEGLWDVHGELNIAKLMLLSRTFAQSVAGVPTSMSFDGDHGNFTLVWQAEVAQQRSNITSAETRIFLNRQIHYPKGAKVTLTPPHAASIAAPTNSNIITITYNSGAVQTGDILTLIINAL